MVRTLLAERDHEKHRAEEQKRHAEEQKRHAEEQKQRAQAQAQRAEELQVELLRLQLELERFKKWYYGPRADRLQSTGELAQLLLNFAEELEAKADSSGRCSAPAESAEEQRRVKRRKGRRHLANFENLPVTTRVHELSGNERACPCCGESVRRSAPMRAGRWNIFPATSSASIMSARSMPVRVASTRASNPRMEAAAKPEAAIDKGMAGPGLLAYIVTSKFADYLPLYRLEDIFPRQGFEISRATQSVWCGDVADLVEPLYELMAERCGPRMWWPPTTPSCPC